MIKYLIREMGNWSAETQYNLEMFQGNPNLILTPRVLADNVSYTGNGTATPQLGVQPGLDSAWSADGASANGPVSTITQGSYTLQETDANTFKVCNYVAPQAIIIPPSSDIDFPLSTEVAFFQEGAGQVYFVAGSGVSLLAINGDLGIDTQYAAASIKLIDDDTWSVIGNLSTGPVSFLSTWDTENLSAGSSTSSQIALPLEAGGTYNFDIDWGDGQTDTITTWNQAETTHTYETPGTYTLSIIGTCTGFRFNNTGDRLKLLDVTAWGDLNLGNSNGYFYGCANLTLDGVSDVLDLTGTLTLASAFQNCTSITTIAHLDSWLTSSVTNLSATFSGCTSFNGHVGSWTTTSVTNMSNLFNGCSLFNQALAAWNTASVTNMSGMFQGAIAFNYPVATSGGLWNVASVTNMSNMFNTASAFNQALSTWNTASATNMSGMFQGAIAFDQALSAWTTTSVTNMSNMFNGAVLFNRNLNTWNTGNVTNMSYIFANATLFNGLITSWTMTNVANMSHMFYQAVSFNQAIVNWNTTGATDMSYMFAGAIVFNQSINTSISIWNTNGVLTMTHMFDGCTAFNGNIAGWDTSTVTDMSYMFRSASVFNQNITTWVTAAVTTMAHMFDNAVAFNQVINTVSSAWDVSDVTDMSSMFRDAIAFNSNITSWVTSSVTTMANMFQGALLFNQNIGSWNTASVTNMFTMFGGAAAFQQDIGGWDVTEVTNMALMFNGVTLSTTNYNALLIGWGGQTVQHNVQFSGGNSQYTAAAIAARAVLTNNYTWVITDGGLA